MSWPNDLLDETLDIQRNALKRLLKRVGAALDRRGNIDDGLLFLKAADATLPEGHLAEWIMAASPSPATHFLVERGRYELTAESLAWDPRFRALFDIDVRALAQERLAPFDPTSTRLFEDEQQQIQSGLRILRHAIRASQAGDFSLDDRAVLVFAANLLRKILAIKDVDPSALEQLKSPDVPLVCLNLMIAAADCVAAIQDEFVIRTVTAEEIEFGAYEFDPSFDLNPDVISDAPWIECNHEWVLDRVNEQVKAQMGGLQPSAELVQQVVTREIIREVQPVRRSFLEAAKQRRDQMATRLGSERFRALQKNAQEWLEQCEYLFGLEEQMPRPAAIIHAIATAFECQLAGLLYECAEYVVRNHPAVDRYPRLPKGRMVLNNRASRLRTLREMEDNLQAIANDPLVDGFWAQRHLKPEKILSTIDLVRKDRNRSVHEGGYDLASISTICAEWLAEDGGIFKYLVGVLPGGKAAGQARIE